MDALHYALLAVVVLLAVYTFGSFREGNSDCSKYYNKESCLNSKCMWNYPQVVGQLSSPFCADKEYKPTVVNGRITNLPFQEMSDESKK